MQSLSWYSTLPPPRKAATDNTYVNGHDWIPIKLYLQSNQWAEFGLPTLPLMQEWWHIWQKWLTDRGVHLLPESKTQFQALTKCATSGNLLNSLCARIFIFKMETVNIMYLKGLLWESKPCRQMLTTVTGTHKYAINISCLHHDLHHHHLRQLTDRIVSTAWDEGQECALQRESIFHGSAQMHNNIPSTHPPLPKCQGKLDIFLY